MFPLDEYGSSLAYTRSGPNPSPSNVFFFTSSGFSLGTSAALHYGEKYVWKICLTLVDEYRSSHYMIQSTQDPNSPTTVTAGVYSDSHFVFRNNSNF